MTNEEYVQAALRTESLSDEVRLRFNHKQNMAGLIRAVNQTMNWVRQVDAYKKFLFYGKWNAVIQLTRSEEPRSLADDVNPKNPEDQQIRLLHAAMGMLTEAGELLEGLCGPGELDGTNLIEEVGDVFWYQAIAADVLNTSFAEIQERNIAKLKARYPGKFENVRAVERDLGREREALTSTTTMEETK